MVTLDEQPLAGLSLTGIWGPRARTAAAVGGPPRSTRARVRASAAARGESASPISSPPRRSMYSSGSSCTPDRVVPGLRLWGPGYVWPAEL